MNNNMKKISKEELTKVLAEHKVFLDSYGERGTRADLRGANLIGANLSEANLHVANLSGADLSKADLTETNLSRVDLTLIKKEKKI
jgi:uncharacterized protein YjbI with pentapeptide repeats